MFVFAFLGVMFLFVLFRCDVCVCSGCLLCCVPMIYMLIYLTFVC